MSACMTRRISKTEQKELIGGVGRGSVIKRVGGGVGEVKSREVASGQCEALLERIQGWERHQGGRQSIPVSGGPGEKGHLVVVSPRMWDLEGQLVGMSRDSAHRGSIMGDWYRNQAIDDLVKHDQSGLAPPLH